MKHQDHFTYHTIRRNRNNQIYLNIDGIEVQRKSLVYCAIRVGFGHKHQDKICLLQRKVQWNSTTNQLMNPSINPYIRLYSMEHQTESENSVT